MTAKDVEARILSQCRGSGTFDTPQILGQWKVKRVRGVEAAVHQVLKARGRWRRSRLPVRSPALSLCGLL